MKQNKWPPQKKTQKETTLTLCDRPLVLSFSFSPSLSVPFGREHYLFKCGISNTESLCSGGLVAEEVTLMCSLPFSKMSPVSLVCMNHINRTSAIFSFTDLVPPVLLSTDSMHRLNVKLILWHWLKNSLYLTLCTHKQAEKQIVG